MFLHNRHCLYGQEGWPGKSKMWYPWSIAWQLVSGADLWLLHLVFHIPFLFAVFVTMWQLLIHILVDAQAKKYDLTQVHLIWITHCIFDIVKEHNISMTFFDKRGVVQIWGSQDSYKALKNVWQCTTYFPSLSPLSECFLMLENQLFYCANKQCAQTLECFLRLKKSSLRTRGKSTTNWR